MTTITARQPRGIPVGGQFAATTHAEPGAELLTPTDVHKHTHTGLMGDGLNSSEEARIARAAIHHSLISGEFGGETLAVSDLAQDDRLVRLAVDRYVTTEHNEPGAFQPEDTGHRLGRLLLELQDEDIENAVYALKEENS